MDPTQHGEPLPPVSRRSARLAWGRFIVLAAIIPVAAVVAGLIGLPDPEQLAAEVTAIGPAAPAGFVLLYAVVTLVPLPKNVLTVIAGLLFGLFGGTVPALLGALLGAVAAFGLGRVLGRDAVERVTGRRAARIDALLSRHGFLAVLGVRLVPVLPFTAINYAAGLTAVRNRDYLLGTALGIIPGTIAYASLGAYGTSPGSWPFALAVLGLVALTVGGAVAAHRYRRRSEPAPGGQGQPGQLAGPMQGAVGSAELVGRGWTAVIGIRVAGRRLPRPRRPCGRR
jgi:uncharacterized membrane protein YdjX (TVP38/TMEM64 family)